MWFLGAQVLDIFGTDVYAAAFTLVLVLLGLMRGESPTNITANFEKSVLNIATLNVDEVVATSAMHSIWYTAASIGP